MTNNRCFAGLVCDCCCLIPLRLLERLSGSGDPNLASAAARTVRLTASMQAFRAQLSTGAPPPTAAVRTGLRRQVIRRWRIRR
jgi:hypothetical protein